MSIVAPTPENLERAAALLRNGGVVAFPTETVYGLGANAFDARAVARVFEIKRRPSFDPLIVHIATPAMLARITSPISSAARALMSHFWPGPLTIVLPKLPAVPDLVTSGLPTVAVRMPSHAIARELIARADVPIAAPSANPFGYLSPTRAEHVQRMLGDAVDMIVDGGSTEHGVESTVVLLEPVATLLRHGALPIEEIEAIVGSLTLELSGQASLLSPGQMPQHYSPRIPLRLIEPSTVATGDRSGAAALTFERTIDGYAKNFVLSPEGDLREAAAHLFEYLHLLDCSDVTRIDAQPLPERSLGAAIMDRLRRASTARPV